MKKMLVLVSVFLFSASAVAFSDLSLKPGEALIKTSKSKSVLQVLTINYNPVETGTLDVSVFDNRGQLLAHQNEKVSQVNSVATTVVYLGGKNESDSVIAVLDGAGFKNKQLECTLG